MKKVLALLTATAALTVGLELIAPQKASAGWWAGGGGGGRSASGGGGGAGRSGPTGGGQRGRGGSAAPAPAPKKRVISPGGNTGAGGPSAVGGGGGQVDPDFKGAGPDTWASAKTGQRPIVFYFVDMNSKTAFDEEIAKLSKGEAVFVRVMKVSLTGIEEATKDNKKAAKPIIPEAKMSQLDLWQAYGVKSAGSVIVADWYGNEFNRYPSMPTASVLKSAIGNVGETVPKKEKELQKIADNAQAAADKGDSKGAVRAVLAYFKKGLTGYDTFNGVVALYNKLVEEGRTKLAAAREANDEAVMKDLAATFKGTDLEPELKEIKN